MLYNSKRTEFTLVQNNRRDNRALINRHRKVPPHQVRPEINLLLPILLLNPLSILTRELCIPSYPYTLNKCLLDEQPNSAVNYQQVHKLISL